MNKEIKIGSALFDSEYIVDKLLGTGGEGTTYVVHSLDNPRKKLCAKVFIKPEKIDEQF
ncbi:MAG: hypothetical protein MJ223_01485 [Mycoplasmoidaceae bacterium]|nr:hypothetical protein [Mycoplasmoidaceae bacterium]